MRELFFHILNGAAVRIGGAIKRIGSAPGAKYSSFILIHINMNRYAICIVCGIMLSSILQLPCIIKNVALYIKTVVSCKTY